MPRFAILTVLAVVFTFVLSVPTSSADEPDHIAFFEKKIRPLLAEHCFKCHSEESKKKRGGLLLDRKSGWIKGGDTGKAVVPGEPEASLLIRAVRYEDEDMQMPPNGKLDDDSIKLLEAWVKAGAPAPAELAETEFSRLGDQEYLFSRAKDHWAFQPVAKVTPPKAANPAWNQHAIDQFVYAGLVKHKFTPSKQADARTLIRRLSFDLTGLPPTPEKVNKFVADYEKNPAATYKKAVDELIASKAFGEHFARMWLDVARYADTDSFYRPDTRTPHYFPFAFTYRDYVIDSFNADKPYDQFIREQLAADLMKSDDNPQPLAALGFLAVGPHANRNQPEALDDWIDVTTRGLMGMTASCARCHDHKYEPIPTADYYSLRGVFASIVRIHPLDENRLPIVPGYEPSKEDRKDYETKRAAIDKKIAAAGSKKAKNNNRGLAKQIKETELAQLLSFHPGAPARAMIVIDRGRPLEPVVFVRGDPGNKGKTVSRDFLKVLDPKETPFSDKSSGRLDLANKIVDPSNPLTARVFVNRVWGVLMGSYLVDTPSDFGLQGSTPTHPELLDSLANDFVNNGWSLKRLVRNIVMSQTYQQDSKHREDMAAIDPTNKQLWRANRKHLSIEILRDSLLSVSGQLDRTMHGRPAMLWGKDYTKRRTIYGYINRFNLDPTLRTFDFPSPMQSKGARAESIVPTQSLFTLNSPFVIDQSVALTIKSDTFKVCKNNKERISLLFQVVYQRDPNKAEFAHINQFVLAQRKVLTNPSGKARSPWPLVAQALLMSNEFQYVD